MTDNLITPDFRAAFISVFKATSMKNADGSINKLAKYSIRRWRQFPPTHGTSSTRSRRRPRPPHRTNGATKSPRPCALRSV